MVASHVDSVGFSDFCLHPDKMMVIGILFQALTVFKKYKKMKQHSVFPETIFRKTTDSIFGGLNDTSRKISGKMRCW